MWKIMLAIPLVAVAFLAFAQVIQPVAIDDLLKNADQMRCSIAREISETALSNCRHEQGRY